jgi:hypothetical protein
MFKGLHFLLEQHCNREVIILVAVGASHSISPELSYLHSFLIFQGRTAVFCESLLCKRSFSETKMSSTGPAPGSLIVVSNRLPFVLKRNTHTEKLERKAR